MKILKQKTFFLSFFLSFFFFFFFLLFTSLWSTKDEISTKKRHFMLGKNLEK